MLLSVMDATDQTAGEEFERFLGTVEPRLRVALTAAYGLADGRAAVVDALSWAWEHWAKVREMANPAGYLFRVGQTAARRMKARAYPDPADRLVTTDERRILDIDLLRSLGDLSEQQRLVVLLVHAFGWTVRDTAEFLEVAASTVQTHAERGLARLRTSLPDPHTNEVSHVHNA